jgi:hypothetical protein
MTRKREGFVDNPFLFLQTDRYVNALTTAYRSLYPTQQTREDKTQQTREPDEELAGQGPPFEGDLSFSEEEAVDLRLQVAREPQRWNRLRVAQHFTRLELIDREVSDHTAIVVSSPAKGRKERRRLRDVDRAARARPIVVTQSLLRRGKEEKERERERERRGERGRDDSQRRSVTGRRSKV